jgi:SAM-dependent methyltransferase
VFGEKLDYRLLRRIATDRNRATEAELDEIARRTSYSLDDARAHLERVRDVYFDGRLEVDPSLHYLDVGSGTGRLSIGLALAGARHVTGVEVLPRWVAQSEALAAALPPDVRPRFHNVDVHEWTPPRRYDVVFSIGAIEHIHDPRRFLDLLPRLLAPNGRAFVSHEPFEGPVGDHLTQVFRFQIPWRGLLFSERALLRLRTEFYRPGDPVTRFEDVAGGLNRMSFAQYLRWARDAGLEFEFHAFNPQLKHHPRLRPLYPLSWLLTRLPGLQGLFILNAYSILRRRDAGAPA